MSDLFRNFNEQTAIKAIYVAEGGEKFTDDPDDNGGETRWGITKAVAYENKALWSAHNWNGDMSKLPESLAYAIYKKDFWDSLRLTEVMYYSKLLSYLLFNIGVNSHPSVAAKHLQRALNVFNNQGTLYPDLNVDGNLGSKSLNTLDVFLKHRRKQGLQVLINTINGFQSTYYVTIAEKRPTQEKWSYGWASRLFHAIEAFKDELF